MTINLTELKDEPLGKHPIQADLFVFPCALCMVTETEQGVVAADDESSFTFDVDGLSDEALDPPPSLFAFASSTCNCLGTCIGIKRLSNSDLVDMQGGGA